MDDGAMRRFPVPDRDNLPDDLHERIDDETERASFTPNVFAAFAYKLSHFRPFLECHDALIEDTDLERHGVEMIIVAVSGVNHCYCCNVTHDALVHIYAKDPLLADQLVANYHTAGIPEKRKTMLGVAVKLTESPVEVGRDDLQRLRDASFSEEVIWDIGTVTTFFDLNNRMTIFADMRLNKEFHTLGRGPRDD